MERTLQHNNLNIEILTPSGWSDFSGVSKIQSRLITQVKTESGETIKCTSEHKLKVDDGIYTPVLLLNVEDNILNSLGEFDKIISIERDVATEDVYDAIDVELENEYYTNWLVSKNCEFLGSSMTLIDGRKIAQISTIPAIHETRDGFSFYDKVDRDHTYIMVVDTARGTGLDYSAFIVFDTSTVPFKVVCTFRNNNVHTIVFPKYIMEAAVYFNSCYILIETNDLGQQIVDILKEDLEYDGLISTASKKSRYEATSGFGVMSQTGVRTTKTVKRLGCSTFKSMVESDQLQINDHNLLEEMSKFVYNGKGSYEAENGNDDLVMCGVLFAWLTTQPYFKELTNTDLVRSIYRIGTEDMDDMMVPFGHIEDGRGDTGTSDGIDYWTSD